MSPRAAVPRPKAGTRHSKSPSTKALRLVPGGSWHHAAGLVAATQGASVHIMGKVMELETTQPGQGTPSLQEVRQRAQSSSQQQGDSVFSQHAHTVL